MLVAVFAGTGNYASAQGFSDGFVAATVACAGLAVLGVVAGAVLPGHRAPKPAATAAPALEGKG